MCKSIKSTKLIELAQMNEMSIGEIIMVKKPRKSKALDKELEELYDLAAAQGMTPAEYLREEAKKILAEK